MKQFIAMYSIYLLATVFGPILFLGERDISFVGLAIDCVLTFSLLIVVTLFHVPKKRGGGQSKVYKVKSTMILLVVSCSPQ